MWRQLQSLASSFSEETVSVRESKGDATDSLARLLTMSENCEKQINSILANMKQRVVSLAEKERELNGSFGFESSLRSPSASYSPTSIRTPTNPKARPSLTQNASPDLPPSSPTSSFTVSPTAARATNPRSGCVYDDPMDSLLQHFSPFPMKNGERSVVQKVSDDLVLQQLMSDGVPLTDEMQASLGTFQGDKATLQTTSELVGEVRAGMQLAGRPPLPAFWWEECSDHVCTELVTKTFPRLQAWLLSVMEAAETNLAASHLTNPDTESVDARTSLTAEKVERDTYSSVDAEEGAVGSSGGPGVPCETTNDSEGSLYFNYSRIFEEEEEDGTERNSSLLELAKRLHSELALLCVLQELASICNRNAETNRRSTLGEVTSFLKSVVQDRLFVYHRTLEKEKVVSAEESLISTRLVLDSVSYLFLLTSDSSKLVQFAGTVAPPLLLWVKTKPCSCTEDEPNGNSLQTDMIPHVWCSSVIHSITSQIADLQKVYHSVEDTRTIQSYVYPLSDTVLSGLETLLQHGLLPSYTVPAEPALDTTPADWFALPPSRAAESEKSPTRTSAKITDCGVTIDAPHVREVLQEYTSLVEGSSSTVKGQPFLSTMIYCPVSKSRCFDPIVGGVLMVGDEEEEKAILRDMVLVDGPLAYLSCANRLGPPWEVQEDGGTPRRGRSAGEYPSASADIPVADAVVAGTPVHAVKKENILLSFLKLKLLSSKMESNRDQCNVPQLLSCGHVISLRSWFLLSSMAHRTQLDPSLAIRCPYCTAPSPFGEIITVSYLF
ncbi:hypothetical protein AGDE_14345 [Angomonas deanei]|uniref:Uncharacterized protein n=1 Tax=Angomonas deanei TaxID=59799 RepID=A0A7G2C7Q5_9TRYP|nr:hypothetical protein AGDE_14345 [Angomonas deanei]CAD2215860.1 hypothetical protein, conserved [Angomonas deanei]|eukprot:EPY20981.1 hypothetical protein AGDE_14345 [Angomonas deanei]